MGEMRSISLMGGYFRFHSRKGNVQDAAVEPRSCVLTMDDRRAQCRARGRALALRSDESRKETGKSDRYVGAKGQSEFGFSSARPVGGDSR